MKLRFILSLCFVFIITACQNHSGEKIVLNVGGVETSADEFEASFRHSAYSKEDTQSSRADFLEAYIIRILILQEAERLGLDKDPAFLQDVQDFWQRSLVKLALDKKMRSVAETAVIGEEDVKQYYLAHRESDFPDKELAQVQDTIRWIIMRRRQEQVLSGWIDELKKKTRIDVEYKALGVSR